VHQPQNYADQPALKGTTTSVLVIAEPHRSPVMRSGCPSMPPLLCAGLNFCGPSVRNSDMGVSDVTARLCRGIQTMSRYKSTIDTERGAERAESQPRPTLPCTIGPDGTEVRGPCPNF
jgi:hypothetical protein